MLHAVTPTLYMMLGAFAVKTKWRDSTDCYKLIIRKMALTHAGILLVLISTGLGKDCHQLSPVASRNGSQGMPGHPPKYGLVVPHSSSTQIIIDWLRFLAIAVFISVTVTIMLNADINVSLDFTVV